MKPELTLDLCARLVVRAGRTPFLQRTTGSVKTANTIAAVSCQPRHRSAGPHDLLRIIC